MECFQKVFLPFVGPLAWGEGQWWDFLVTVRLVTCAEHADVVQTAHVASLELVGHFVLHGVVGAPMSYKVMGDPIRGLTRGPYRSLARTSGSWGAVKDRGAESLL